MRLYPAFFKAAFSWMDPELAHTLGFAGIKLAHRTGLGRVLSRMTAPDEGAEVNVMGLTFPSPFGLAAGFDKGATGTHALTQLGFGHVEIGTVTGQAQPGNPRPRLFRLVRDRAVINRMGFNNDGAEAVAPRVAAALQTLAQLGRGDAEHPPRRTIAVIGGMHELGDESIAAHADLGQLLVRLNISHVVAVGDLARPVYTAATLEGSWGEEALWVPDAEAAEEHLRTVLRPGDIVLLKSSNAAGLNHLGDRIARDGADSNDRKG
ncbi:MAG TPA: hypothetical protein DDY46_00280 [Kocuria sp.]|nr:hypothetical protein [Kocuria sp.]